MEAIGTVSNLQGTVHAEADDGSVRALAQGSPIYAGDEVITAKGANVEILFKDETILAQGEDSRQEIDSYVYDPQDADSSNLLVNMTQGTFRLVTGQIAKANPEGVDVRTPLATIGIRGTGVDFDLSGTVQKIGCFLYDHLDIVITTAQGTRLINAVNQILNVLQNGEFGEIRTYEQFEKAFFKAAAPIINLPPDAQYGGEGEGGGDGDEGGDPNLWGNAVVLNLDDVLKVIQGLIEDAVGDLPGAPTGVVGLIMILADLQDIIDFQDLLPGEDANYYLNLIDEFLADLPDAIANADSDGTGLPVPAGYNSVEGTSGDDFVYCEDPLHATSGDDFIRTYDGDDNIYAEEGNDIIYGGAGADTIRGEDGDDTIYGGLDNDTLYGASGADVIRGGSGNDFIQGGAGTDLIEGNDGDDTIYGSVGSTTGLGGNDTIYGGEGNDTIYGSESADLIAGGTGDDSIRGDTDNDTISGDAGEDTIDGESGLDVIDGGDDNDSLSGGDSNDIISGGSGNDIIWGDSGADVLTGGAGMDQFCYSATTEGGDTIADFTHGEDVFVLSGALAGVGFSQDASRIGGIYNTIDTDNFRQFSGSYDGTGAAFGDSATGIVVDTDGKVWYDANGDDAGGITLLAQITGTADATDFALESGP